MKDIMCTMDTWAVKPGSLLMKCTIQAVTPWPSFLFRDQGNEQAYALPIMQSAGSENDASVIKAAHEAQGTGHGGHAQTADMGVIWGGQAILP